MGYATRIPQNSFAPGDLRQCSRCLLSFPATPEHFYHRTNGKIARECKRCVRASVACRRMADPATHLAARKAWRKNNPESVRMSRKLFSDKHPEKCLAWAKSFSKKNPEKVAAYKRLSKDKNRQEHNARIRERLRTDRNYALNNRIRAAIGLALRGKKNGKTWQSIVGYSAETLRRHLERQFTAGMSWAAFLRGEIHIDHRRPVSSFRFDGPDDEQFRDCWSLSNLQPLWARDNLQKHAQRLLLV